MSTDGESFSGLLLRLRGRIALTQRELATRVGVNVSSIQGWEAGANYPSVANLKALIGAAFVAGGFADGHAAAEAAALWAAAVRDAPRFRTPFDRAWFDQTFGLPNTTAAADTGPGRRDSWAEASDVAEFIGRASERALLRRWVLEEHVRVIALFGIGGIGKSLLATRVARDLVSSFENVVWRSLRDAQTPAEWLAEVVSFLAPDDGPFTQAESTLARRLLEIFAEKRCLLVLDNLETVLETRGRVGTYLPGYERYGVLLRQLAETPHQSCVIVTSREEPTELGMLRGAQGPVRALDLAGFGVDEGRALLSDKQLQGESDAWGALVQGHDGNALALKLVGETIRDTFAGSIAAYLEFANVPSVMVGALQDLLATQISRISDDEHDLLRRMAVAREPVGVAELAAGLAPRVNRAAALAAIEGLRRRSLLEHADGSSRWGLHPVVQEYTTQELIGDVRRELDTRELRILQRQPLLEATTKDYVRRAQERLIVGPIVGGLRALDGNGQVAEQRLLLLLAEQRGRSIEQQGYAPGNLINLLVALRGDLKGVDLSGLAIRQAYLHDIEAQEASFAGAHVLETVLGEAFTYATCLALSADGAHLIAGTAGGEVCRWRVADRTLVATVTGHDGGVYSVALSEDGRLIASAGYDGTIRLWEAEGARALMVLNGHSGGVRAVALSADGRLLASGGMDGTLRIWDTATGVQRKMIDAHLGGVRAVAICARGKLIASGGVDGVVRVWNADDGEAVATLAGHTGSINSVALSAEGGVVASGSLDSTIRVWHTEGAEPGATLEGHAGSVDSIALGVDGQRIVSGSLDGSVRVWEAASGRALATLHGHTGGVRSIAVSGDGQLIASASIDGTVRLWETEGGRPLAVLRGYSSAIVSVAVSSDRRIVASGSFDGTVRLRNVETGHALTALRGHTGTVRRIAISADGGRLASAGFDGTIRIWDAAKRVPVAVLRGHTGAVRGVAWSADGRLIASGGIDSTIRLWEGPSGFEQAILRGHDGGVWSVALSDDGRLLASSGDDGTVRLWNTEERRSVAALRGHAGGVWGVALTGDGRVLASSGVDGTVRLWDARSGEPRGIFRGHTGLAYGVALSGDGRLAASSGVDGTVRVWDTRTGEPFGVFQGHTGLVYGVWLSSDGELVASSGVDGTVRLWDVSTGQCLRVLRDDRRFERANIAGLTGITEAQWHTLIALGATDVFSNSNSNSNFDSSSNQSTTQFQSTG